MCRSVTSRARPRQEPQGVASAWQPDMSLSDQVLVSTLTFEFSLIYTIKRFKMTNIQ